MAKDYYQLLGVSSSAPEREIKRAYHDLARTMHPDKAASPEDAARLQEEFGAVTKAYNTLKDPEKRREYDAKRAKEGPSPAANAGDPASPAGAPAPPGPSSPAAGKAPAKGAPAAASPGADKRIEAARQTIAERAFSRGMQLVNMGDHVRAVDFFETAIKNNPEDGRFHARLAQTLMKARRGFTRAVEVASRACELDPYNIEYKMILAQIYEQAGSKSNAIKTYENVLKWDAGNAEATARLEALQGKVSKSFFGGLYASFRKKIGL